MNLSIKSIGETLRSEKSSVRMMSSSKSKRLCLVNSTLCSSLTMLIVRLREGDIGSSIFAAIKIAATDRLIKHGGAV